MKKFLTNNWALKILSIIVAVLIWYLVVQVSNPYTRQPYDVPVEILNESYIVSGKKTFRIDDQYRTLRVTVGANQSTLKKLDVSKIRLTADLTQIVDMTSSPVYVPVNVSVDLTGIDEKNITLSRTTIPITIEDIENATFDVEADCEGKPGSGYEVGTVSLNPATVNISGPESIIDIIGRVVAKINVNGMKEDGIETAEFKIYDKNGTEFTEKTMDYLTFDNGMTPQINAEISLWKKREKVKIRVEYSGEPAQRFQVGEVTATPSEVTVVGSQEALDELAEAGNVITIPGELVNIDYASQDRDDFSIDLMKDKVLDETKIRVAENTSAIKVVVTVLPNGSQEFLMDVEQIQKMNLAEDLTLSYDQSTVPIRIKASDHNLDQFDPAAMVQASIDLSNKGEGDYPVTVNVSLPEGYELVDRVSTVVHLKKKAEVTKTDGD